MDKIRRSFFNPDGSKRTGLTVLARPILGGSDIPMPETSVGVSGIYASVIEEPHGAYSIYVNGVDTGDTQTVEPWLHMRSYPSNKTDTSMIDVTLSARQLLSFYASGKKESILDSEIKTAFEFCNGRTLYWDMDNVEIGTSISVSVSINIDLCGRTISTANSVVVSASPSVYVSNGKLKLGSGSRFTGSDCEFFDKINFLSVGLQNTQSAAAQLGIQSFVACIGLVSRIIPSAYGVGQISYSGCDVPGMDQIKITDTAKATSFFTNDVDSCISDAGKNGFIATNKASLSKMIALNGGYSTTQRRVELGSDTSPTPTEMGLGIRSGVRVFFDGTGSASLVRACLPVTTYPASYSPTVMGYLISFGNLTEACSKFLAGFRKPNSTATSLLGSYHSISRLIRKDGSTWTSYGAIDNIAFADSGDARGLVDLSGSNIFLSGVPTDHTISQWIEVDFFVGSSVHHVDSPIGFRQVMG